MTSEKQTYTTEQKDAIISAKLAGTRFNGSETITIPLDYVPDDLRHEEALEALGIIDDEVWTTTIRGFGHVCIDFFRQDTVDTEIIELTMDGWSVEGA